jgi:hypothetical protein
MKRNDMNNDHIQDFMYSLRNSACPAISMVHARAFL